MIETEILSESAKLYIIETIKIWIRFMNQPYFQANRITNKEEDEVYKNNKYSTFIIMEQVRKETGNSRLCYMDLSPHEQESFNKRVKQFEKEHPAPKSFQSLVYQQEFYEKEGVFGDISEEKLKEMIKQAEKDKNYRKKRKSA